MADLSVAESLSGGLFGLSSGLNDLLVVEIGGNQVLYALNRAESRLFELSVSVSGQLSVADTLAFSGMVVAGTEARLALGDTLAGGKSLILSGIAEQFGQQVTLSATGALGSQTALTGVGALDQAATLTVAGTPIVVAAADGGGLYHFADTGSGFGAGTGLVDSGQTYLADVSASVGFVAQGVAYVATASATEHGVTVASVSPSGLTMTGAIGATDSLPVGRPSDIAAVTQFDETWLFVASEGTSSLSILQVADGVPRLSDHVYDDDTTRFQGASQLATLAYGDIVFVAAGGAEGGVSLLTMLPGGRLVHLDSVADDETVPLDQISDLELFLSGDALQIVAGSGNAPGLTRLSYDLSDSGQVLLAANDGLPVSGTPDNDQVIGSAASEALMGGAGDDILLDGHGADTFSGGSGADLFVLTADGSSDDILDFELGTDRIDLSAFDFLYNVGQLSVVPTATGAVISFGDEVLNVTTANQAPLTLGDLTTADVLNINRPPVLPVGQDIVGTAGDETIIGGAGDDTISGLGGADSVVGGAGQDVLSGNQGNDILHGDGGNDSLYGGAGDDLLWGGDGNDIIYGDDWA